MEVITALCIVSVWYTKPDGTLKHLLLIQRILLLCGWYCSQPSLDVLFTEEIYNLAHFITCIFKVYTTPPGKFLCGGSALFLGKCISNVVINICTSKMPSI